MGCRVSGLGSRVQGRGWMEVEHLVGGSEAEGGVEGPAGVRGVEGDDAKSAAAGFVEAELEKVSCEALAAMGRVDIHVEDVAAVVVRGVEGMGRPLKQEETGGGDGLVIGLDDPAEVFAFGEHTPEPGREVEAHGGEGVVATVWGHGYTIRAIGEELPAPQVKTETLPQSAGVERRRDDVKLDYAP